MTFSLVPVTADKPVWTRAAIASVPGAIPAPAVFTSPSRPALFPFGGRHG